MTQQKITIAYLTGFIESDGTFLIFFSGRDLKVEVRVGQKSNTNTLEDIKTFLDGHGIPSYPMQGKETTAEHRGRAPARRIGGHENVRKLMDLLSSENEHFVFVGVKQRDLMIMQKILSYSLTISQRLGLKKSFHKMNRNEPDSEQVGSVPRAEYERRFGLRPNQSVVDSEPILRQIDEAFEHHLASLRQRIAEKSLVVSHEYFTGVVDADGYYGVGFRQKTENRPRKGGNYPLFEGAFEVTTEKGGNLEVLLYAVGSQIKPNESGNSVSFVVRNKKELRRVLEFQAVFPPLGDLRQRQLDTLIRYFSLLDNKTLYRPNKRFEEVTEFVNLIYDVSDLSKKGNRRTLCREDALALVNMFYR